MFLNDSVATSGGSKFDGQAGFINEQSATGTLTNGTGGEGAFDEEGSTQFDRFDQLHRRLKRIVKARGSLDLQEAELLREAQETRMWRRYGYSSLVEYMEIELGYTPRLLSSDFASPMHCRSCRRSPRQSSKVTSRSAVRASWFASPRQRPNMSGSMQRRT